jgi:predicted RNA-binding protein with PUA-like domain
MAYWLVKSEPHKYAWADMVRDGRTIWDGVRNNAAAIHLRTMKIGDRAFFYHSNEGKEIVGIVEIVRAHYLDPKDASGRYPAVDVAPVEALAHPVTLAAIKADAQPGGALEGIELVRQSRLSVAPIRAHEWARIIEMSKG